MTDDVSPTSAPPPTTVAIADGAPEAVSGDPLLRLTRCLACDYSLEGLTAIGRCPECGEPYDVHGDLVLLFGWHPGHHQLAANGLMWTLVGWSTFIVLQFLAMALAAPGQGARTQLVCLMVVTVVVAGLELSRRNGDARRAPVRVWLTPAGCGQGRRRRLRPKLTPWPKISAVAIVAAAPDAFRVTCHRDFWQWSWAASSVPVDVEIRCTLADARALETRIARWHPPTQRKAAAAAIARRA